MKRTIFLTAATAVVLSAGAASARSDVGVGININVGNPPPPAVVVAPAPAPVVVAEPPEFIFPSALGFYVAVGVPYDLFYVGNVYYVNRGGEWYRGRTYNGPWDRVGFRSLPPGLRKHRMERIHHYRDMEYREYREHHDRYQGRRFRPDKAEWKERKHEAKEERKEEKRREKEERKEEKWREKEERRGHGRD